MDDSFGRQLPNRNDDRTAPLRSGPGLSGASGPGTDRLPGLLAQPVATPFGIFTLFIVDEDGDIVPADPGQFEVAR